MVKLLDFFSTPFNKNLRFFVVLFLLASSVNFIDRLYYVGIASGIFWSFFGFLECYVLCLFIPLLNSFCKKCYKIILLIVGTLNFITDIVILKISSRGFNEFVGLILGTNISEMYEFFMHYVSSSTVFIVIVGGFIFLLLYFLLGFLKSNKYIVFLGLGVSLISIPLIFKDVHKHYQNIFIGKIYTLVKEYNKNNHNIEDFYSNPSLVTTKKLPNNVVVVIGESFAKDFSSLYGYEKETNPKLSLYPDSLLMLYKNVTSADISTVENIECILSTFTKENCEKDWYECLTLQEILSKLNYKTYWVSNQAEVGLWDNIPTKYAYICDSAIFVGAKNGSYEAVTFDENVISPTQQIIHNDSAPKVIFVHLIGSHPCFEERYPKNRVKFHASDYMNYSDDQRGARSHYDNSIVYNDSVVNEIVKLVHDKETLLFYFPDHGLDVFQTDNSYAGHARRGDAASEKVAKRIPFMIYATPKYQQKYPAEMKRMRESVDNEFVTENFIYALMDIMGVRFKDNNDVEKYTLFNKE